MAVYVSTPATHRDVSTIQKALIYAIAAIESLPERCQEWSDKEDMKDLLVAHFGVHYCDVPSQYRNLLDHFPPNAKSA